MTLIRSFILVITVKVRGTAGTVNPAQRGKSQKTYKTLSANWRTPSRILILSFLGHKKDFFSFDKLRIYNMAIYTRTGDKGKTSLMSGQRVLKSDLRVDTYGTIDELNSAIGVVLSMKYRVLSIERELIRIQNDLLEIGSCLANSDPQYSILNTQYFPGRVREFERFIDLMTEQMPPLKNFILPGGGRAGAVLHLARAISRRAERKIVELNYPSAGRRSPEGDSGQVDNNIIVYINRLSDLLFTMARFANFKEKKKETIWPPKLKKS